MRTIKLFIFLTVLLVAGFQVLATEVKISAPGSQEELLEGLNRTSLSVKTAAREDATAQDIFAAARADYSNLLGTLYSQAYYGASILIEADGVEVSQISPLSVPQSIDVITISIDAGPSFEFSEAELSPLPLGFDLREGFSVGQTAGSLTIQSTVQDALTAWRNSGHAKARVASQRFAANHSNATISANVDIDPGPKLRFGELVITTDGGVRPSRVQAIAALPTGEFFSETEMKSVAERLRRTGAFQSVVLEEAEQIGPDKQIDIIANLEPAKKRRFGFGAEIQSLEGLSLSGFWLHKNLFGGAERFRVDGEVGGIGGNSGGTDYTTSLRYERPATLTAETDFYISAELSALDEPDFTEQTARLEAGFTRSFSDTLSGEIGFGYQYSDVNDADGRSILEHLLLPTAITYDDRDSLVDPKSGYYGRLSLTPFYGIDAGSGDGLRAYADGRTYYSFGEDQRTTFALRGQIGSVMGASAGSVPPGMLFFSGGSGTVRGQGFQSLGVETVDGTIGGRSFAAISGEVRYSINGTWGVVGFYDAGFVSADSAWLDNGKWQSGAGIGVRYNTALGPLRFDVATPLGSNSGSGVEIYIGIGQAF